MTLTGQVLTKLTRLREDQQRQVLAYIDALEAGPKQPLFDPYGICADQRSDLPFEEFQKNRQEMWGDSTDRELE